MEKIFTLVDEPTTKLAAFTGLSVSFSSFLGVSHSHIFSPLWNGRALHHPQETKT